MAIEDTYDTAPVIMKESLEQFIYAIEENPSDVTPYYSFLNQPNECPPRQNCN